VPVAPQPVATFGSASVVPVAPQPLTPAPLPPAAAALPPTTTVASLPASTASSPSVTDSSPIAQPDTPNLGADPYVDAPYVDATGLLSVPDPILLPDSTLAGGASFALMLPASPEIAQLPEAFALAAQRLSATPPALVTFVDPVTGQASDDADPADQQGTLDPAWLLLDADDATGFGTVPSQIRWDSAPP
jgi:hypothetical protein